MTYMVAGRIQKPKVVTVKEQVLIAGCYAAVIVAFWLYGDRIIGTTLNLICQLMLG